MKPLTRKLTAAGTVLALAIPSALLAQDRENWPRSVAIGTATIGGTLYVYGGGMAAVIEEFVGVNASVENTGGPVANATLVNQGELEFGLVTMGPAWQAWAGESEMVPGLEHRNIRALFPMFETPLQIATAGGDSLSALTDLAGKRIGGGSATGTASFLMPRIFDALGVEATLRHASWGDLSRQLGDGMLDVVTYTAGMPVPALMELEATNAVSLYSLSPDETDALVAALPFVAGFTVPAGTYSSITEDVSTVAIWNFAIAHKDLPDDFVYEVVKAVLENNDRMVAAHATARATLAENVGGNNFMWLHPGAIRYYREIGIDIPDALVPPEG